jgi:hypothetical protein
MIYTSVIIIFIIIELVVDDKNIPGFEISCQEPQLINYAHLGFANLENSI